MRVTALVSGIMLVASGYAVAAQDYPARAITMLVPFAAGGPTDTVARLTAEGMSKALGQQVVVENAAGAGGTLASGRAARAEPDGYTILIHHIGMSTAPSLYRKLAYDPRTAFEPIGLISDAPMTVVARPDFKANTFQELVEVAKAEKDKLNFANSGLGAASHLCGMLFMSTIGTQLTTVPYKGNGPIMTDLMGGQIDLSCDQTTNTVSPIKEKKVKGYVLTAPARLDSIPDVPTAKEAGLPAFEISVWHGLYAPEKTPQAIVQKLSEALQTALKESLLIERFKQIATEPVSQERATPQALKAHLSAEIDRWSPIIKAAGQFAD